MVKLTIMVTPSNAYAEKIFAEHPNALWALDDTCDYISLMAEVNKNLNSWTASNLTISGTSDRIDKPFPSSGSVKFTKNTGPTNGTLTSTTTITASDVDGFSIGFFVYQEGFVINSIDFGTNTETKNVTISSFGKWIFVSESFQSLPSNSSIVIKLNYVNTTANTSAIHINGLSVGSWAEEFNYQSLGLTPEIVPSSSISVPAGTYGVKAYNYGSSLNYGYYISSASKLYARNCGVPMVYGAYNSTMLYPNKTSGQPSMIIPGLGFLNQSGQNSTYTFEAWLKIDSNTKSLKRIFGPLMSTDGLYVYDSFIMLKVGSSTSHHYISEWNRPMLIHIQTTPTSASLFLNGEQVISMTLKNISFPNKFNGNIDQDWLGFYAYKDTTYDYGVPKIEVDSIAIYPYEVNEVIAKKRYVYAQGIDFPANLKTAYNGTTVFMDYGLSGYDKNYIYPNFARWDQGFFDNASIDDNFLSSPQYELPELKMYTSSSENTEDIKTQWLLDLYAENYNNTDPYITLKPTQNASFYSNRNSYLYYNSMNILKDRMKVFYGVFQARNDADKEETLIRIENATNDDWFEITNTGNVGTPDISSTISYKIKVGSLSENVKTISIPNEYDIFTVGINIDLYSKIDPAIANFFSDLNNLKMYIGGKNTLDTSLSENSSDGSTFNGIIYKIGFSTQTNLDLNSLIFNFDEFGILNAGTVLIDAGFYNTTTWDNIDSPYDGGLYNTTTWEDTDLIFDGGLYNTTWLTGDIVYDGGAYNTLIWDASIDAQGGISETSDITNHIASHTIKLNKEVDKVSLDSETYSYWQDYVPLSYFATNDDLDFIQINLNYPDFKIFDSNNKYDTTNSSVKSYVTFQKIADGANKIISDVNFPNISLLSKEGFINPTSGWSNTRYEFVNGSVIYVPTTEFPSGLTIKDYAIVIHIQIESKNAITAPVKIKTLQMASRALSEAKTPSSTISSVDNFANEINTKFGSKIYAYKKDTNYLYSSTSSPVSIYKKTSPYLYLTNKSGIKPLKSADSSDSGVMIPTNISKSNNFIITSIQMVMNHEETLFPATETKIFEISSPGQGIVDFYISPINNLRTRAKIYAKQGGSEYAYVNYYLNGQAIKNPIISINEWAVLGLEFFTGINLGAASEVGLIKIKYPVLINNVSYYVSGSNETSQQQNINSWAQISYSGTTQRYWGNTASAIDIYDLGPWSDLPLEGQALTSNIILSISPTTAYKIYTGTNKIIFDTDTASGADIRLHGYQYDLYMGINYDTKILKPV